MEIQEIRPRWNHRWANSPDIEIVLDEGTRSLEWIYEPVYGSGKSVMLISTNNAPWVKFVFIREPDGDPSLHGALGGEYLLTSGETLKSRTGWSSRAGVINQHFRKYIESEICEVVLYYPPYMNTGMAGVCIYADYLKNHPKWPKDCHLVRELRFINEEPVWTISASPDKITKAVENA